MTALDFQNLAYVAAFCGFGGGFAAWALFGALGGLSNLLYDRWLDREDRAFVRAQNVISRSREQGRAGLGMVLVVVLLAVIAAACTSAPISHTDDHGIFMERVRRGSLL